MKKKIIIGILSSIIIASSLNVEVIIAAADNPEEIVVESIGDDLSEEVEVGEKEESAAEGTEGEQEKDIQAVPIDADHFPDAEFREYVSEEFDTDHDNILSVEEMDAAEVMTVRKKVKDMTGVQYFRKLKTISIKSDIDYIDVSCNPELQVLQFWRVNMESLDLSANDQLEELSIELNPMSKVDLSNNHRLRNVTITGCEDDEKLCRIKEIRWPDENNIEELHLRDIAFEESTFTVFPKLTKLYYDWEGLDLSAFPNLEKLEFRTRSLNYSLKEPVYEGILDVTKNPKLKEIVAYGEIPPCEKLDFSHNPELEIVKIDRGVMEDTRNTGWSQEGCEIILNNDKLTKLYISGIPVSKVNLSGCPNLRSLDLMGLDRPGFEKMPLSELDLYSVPKLTMFGVSNSYLQDIDISGNLELKELFFVAELPYFYKLENRELTQYAVTLHRDISLNKNHYYDLSKISGYENGCIKSVKGGTLKGSRLYPTAQEVRCEFYMDDAKKYVGTLRCYVSGQMAPLPVQGLALKGRTSSSITFQWKKTDDADGYRVYAKNMETGEIEQRKSLSKSTNSYTFKNLKAGGKYTVIVRAYKSYHETYRKNSKKKNYYSAYGDSGNTKNYYVLPANTTLKVKSIGSGKVQLSWNGKETDYRSGDSGYLIYYSTSPNGPFTRLAKVPDSINTYVAEKLQKGKVYYFKMRGYIRNAGSSYSKVVKVTVK